MRKLILSVILALLPAREALAAYGTTPGVCKKGTLTGSVLCTGILNTETVNGSGFPNTISGGQGNSIQSDGGTPDGGSTISGGYSNNIGTGTNVNHANSNTISGGSNNFLAGGGATIGGGHGNIIYGGDETIGGGSGNTIGVDPSGGSENTISGGDGNTINDGSILSAIVGGTIGGGAGNVVGGQFSTVCGGLTNTAGSSFGGSFFQHATVCGGQSNSATGEGSTIPGGVSNRASGQYTFAVGSYCEASATGAGCMNDGSFAPTYSVNSSSNSLLLAYLNGVRISTGPLLISTGSYIQFPDGTQQRSAASGGGVTGAGTSGTYPIWTGAAALGNGTISATASQLNVLAPTADGSAIAVTATDNNVSGAGGSVAIKGGDGNSGVNDFGGAVSLTGGANTSGSKRGGTAAVTGGAGAGANGGAVTVAGGADSSSGIGGAANLLGGNGNAGGIGGAVAVTGGRGNGGGGGNVVVKGGDDNNAGAGGNASLTGGPATGNGVPGNAFIDGGQASGTNNGGNVTITAGQKSGAGTSDGSLTINPRTSTATVTGKFGVQDGTQGTGKVFTSDASGNGKWSTPTVYASTSSFPMTMGGFSSTLGLGTTFFATTPDSAIVLKRITVTVVIAGTGGAGDVYRCQDASGNFISVTSAAGAAAGTVTTATGSANIASGTRVNGLEYSSAAATPPTVNVLCEYFSQ